MIETVGLTKRYGDHTAVQNLNLLVRRGEIYGFLGPNGAGKTTTISMLLGIVPATAGEVYLLGERMDRKALGLRRRIGVLGESQYLYGDMTAREYLRFFARFYEVENAEERITALLGQLDLSHFGNKLLRSYSKGMKQKLGLARALLHDPELLILDEPVSSLDPHGIRQVRDILLEENRKGKTLFISSHILSEIERTCHRVGIINKGSLVVEDTMDGIKQRVADEVNLEIEVESPVEGIVSRLRELRFVTGVDVHERVLTIRAKADGDIRGIVSRAVTDAGAVIVGMRLVELTLEDAFVTITDSNVDRFAEGVLAS